MKLSFNFNIKDLSGQAFAGESHAGKVLASYLAQMNKGNAIKLYDWAMKLYNKNGIEIDETDSKVLEGLIETSETLPVITKAQLLEHIEEGRKKESSKSGNGVEKKKELKAV